MKKTNLKLNYLLSIVVTILIGIVVVKVDGASGLIKNARANLALQTSLEGVAVNQIDPVAISPDGNILATLGAGGTITLRDIAAGQTLWSQSDPLNDTVTGLAFSLDGKILASVGNNAINLWDVALGQKSASLQLTNTSSAIAKLSFSPDGKRLAGVDQADGILLFNLLTGVSKSMQPDQGVAVDQLQFSPDGMFLVSVTNGKQPKINVWNAGTGQLHSTLPAKQIVTDIAFNPINGVLAIAGQDGIVTLRNPVTGAVQKIIETKQPITAVAFSPDGKSLAAGSNGADPKVQLWNPVSGGLISTNSAEKSAAITEILFSPDGTLLASVGDDFSISLRSVPAGTLQQLLLGQTDLIVKASFSTKQPSLMAVGKDGQLIVWALATGLVQQTVQFPDLFSVPSASSTLLAGNFVSSATAQQVTVPTTSKVSSVATDTLKPNLSSLPSSAKGIRRSAQEWKGVKSFAMSQDGTELGTAGSDGKIRVFKKNGSQRWQVLAHHGSAVAGIVFRGKTKGWVSVGRDTEIKTWDSIGNNLKAFHGPEHPPRTIAISPDGRFIATAGEETRIFIFDAEVGKLNNIFSGHTDFVNGLAFSPDGKKLASAGAEGRILLWDMATGKRLQTLLGHAGEVNSVAFSPDGKLLASASQDSKVILWNVATGQLNRALNGHQGGVRSVAFSPDGGKLVSAGEDTRMLVWNPATGRLTKQLAGSPAAINALAFSPDGNLHVSSVSSEVTEINIDTGVNVDTLKVPVATTLDPQASLSDALFLLTQRNPDVTVLSGFDGKSGIKSAKASNAGVSAFVGQLLDWVIPAANAALPPPPGGPILIVTNGSPSFGNFYAEILRTEGLNEFAVADISTVSASTLAAYDVVILAEIPLSAATQVPIFENWVNGGGNLIAMRPDKDLASLLGLTDTGSTLNNGYLLVDTSTSPGNGIVGGTLQFHGTADRYTLNGATSIATLYNNATTATPNPAITLRSNIGTGSVRGKAAAFTFDLARSLVYTRQGNPAWATQERDTFPPIRSDDKFFGNATGDPQTDWIDFNKIAIPQADEQQRLLVNLIIEMNRNKKPLPRFWYFPRGLKAAVIMTGDDHANGGTAGRFNSFIDSSPSGCSVQNWECIRGTSYIYPDTPLSNAQAASYNTQGFEVGLHINTNCADFTPAQLESFYVDQINTWTAKYSSVPVPITQRHHCIVWSDWLTGAKVQLNHGIRFDTSYYFWPPEWLLNRPGFFSGSGMPMRFVDLDGALIDVYNATTQMTDESGQTYPFTINSLLDKALGAEGYYGAFTINAHTDTATETESVTTVASAQARGVPVITSRQMMDWLDFRNSSSFGAVTWSSNTLTFTVTQGNGVGNVPVNGLQVLMPMQSIAGVLTNLTFNGNPTSFTNTTIKGVGYAAFTGAAGNYVATYAVDTTPPTVSSKTPGAGATGISPGSVVTATFNEAIDPATINATTFELRDVNNNLVTATVSYNPNTNTATLTPISLLAALSTYSATVKGGVTEPRVKDFAGNALAANVVWNFTTGAQPCASSTCSAWPSSTIPSTPSVNDPASVELGVKFRSDINGFVVGIRFYKGNTNTGTHIGNLWSSSGTQLATANFTGETASGWQQVNFSSPVAVTAGTTYIASYFAPNGNYAFTNSPEFATQGVDNPPIHLLKDGVDGGNGLYTFSASSAFPQNTFNSSNYWVDVVFTTNVGPDITSPTVTAQNPAAGATAVPANSVVTATFSETMDAATITTSTVELRGPAPGNVLIPTSVSYNASTRTVTLTPSAALSASIAYTATVKGGTVDPRVKDVAGNALAANSTWTFTTAAAGSAGCSGGTSSIWPTNPTPAIIAEPDTESVELGVKFRSTQNGYICGIRFYKGSANSGTHIGKLWSSSGTLLASANFQNETASGWQQVSFASPVQIVANQQYVASYLAPAGHYSVNDSYFTVGVTSTPLYAFSSAESGGNGVYLYGTGGFPNNTFQTSNYWVDVVFTTSIGPDTTPPTVISTIPVASATGVIPTNPVTVTFSEAMTAASISNSTFQLQDPTNAIVPATVSYSAGTNTATLTPTSTLTASTVYSATVKSGASGVKDSAGNALSADKTWSFTTGVDPCSTGGNPIVCENSKPGNPASEWDISGAGDSSIQGYATDISVNRGQTARFKIDTPSTNYRLDIYRMGYYAGNGARKVATVEPSVFPNQPACFTHSATGLIDCGNWSVTASWAVPANATSGIYVAKVIREDGANTGTSHIVFIVRDDASTSDILFQTSDTTWQAYNNYGGNSLYEGTGPGGGLSGVGRAYKVSYNRPFNTRIVDNGQDWVFNAEYPMVRWLEANGYNVSYFTGVDSDRFGSLIRNHKTFMSNAHDEYWSGQQRTNVEAARDASVSPVNLAFFSGNEVFWKTRWENNITNSSGVLGVDGYRTLVCYKETHAGAKIDPLPNVWTGTWRDPRFSPPADGGKPENALMGNIFTVNGDATSTRSLKVPEADGKMRFWRSTSVANLIAGATEILPFGTLGYEWDEDLDNGFRPAGLVRLSTTIEANVLVLTDYGSSFVNGVANHALTLHKAGSGAIVFGAGTVQWAWGLDSNHDRAGTPVNASMQQATVNLFADMQVQPGTLQAGLVTATASSDVTRPTSVVSAPAQGATIVLGSSVTISGTAIDTGGRVGGVEVSVDGGLTWHPATGRASWTYSWTAPTTSGQVNIKSRAVDDSLNLEIPGTGITVNIGTGSDNTAPTAPSNLSTAQVSGTQINLTWTASSDAGGIAGYRVERCQGVGCTTFAEIAAPTASPFLNNGLTEGVTYRYRVRAVDVAGNLSAYSNIVTAIPDATAPGTPTNLGASASSGTQINLTWTAPLDNVAVTGYRVERCQGVGCSNFAEIATSVGATFSNSGLIAGTSYSYRVRATDAVPNFSGYSNIATATPQTQTLPIAVNDTFLYRANVSRAVTAPGVLANDTDALSRPLSAQLVAGSLAGGGTLNLSANGSFTYLRTTASNTVSFNYQAIAGGLMSTPATGATVSLRVDAAPTTVADNCSYDRSANTVTQPAICTVTGTRVVRMNVAQNDTDSNVTTNTPTDGKGKAVVPNTMLITVAGTGVRVNANAACGQGVLGSSILLPAATIDNNCDGTLMVTMSSTNTANRTYSYVVSDDLGAQSTAQAVVLSSVP